MTSEAQRRANTKWKAKHKDKQRHYNDKSAAKRYIKAASREELQGLESLIQARREEIASGKE